MKGVRAVLLVVLLLVVSGVAALPAKPVRTAHGEFWSFISAGPLRYDVQVAFNVQARGDDDHGSISIRYFDMDTGKLVAVAVSTNVFPIWFTQEGEIYFHADLRTPKWDIPIAPFTWAEFRATDGGAVDDFWTSAPVSLHLTPTSGKIVIR
jgi:hypothetical protein